MNRIELKFRELRKKGEKAFIAFITAGYPDLKTTGELVRTFPESGVDIIELGIPFSDPLADGPLIQDASNHALRKGVNLQKIFALVKACRRSTDIPICFMTYYNPIYTMGEEKFVAACRSCGVDGVIIPDLPMEEGRKLGEGLHHAGVALISFVSPTTTPHRLKKICRQSRGFIYYVSLAGVTGPRSRLPKGLKDQVAKVKAGTSVPVCVGFGVSSPEQVRFLRSFADGVIVGSAIIRRIRDHIGMPGLAQDVAGYVARLSGDRR